MACLPNRARLLDTEHNKIGANVGFRRHLSHYLLPDDTDLEEVVSSVFSKVKTQNFKKLPELWISDATSICFKRYSHLS